MPSFNKRNSRDDKSNNNRRTNSKNPAKGNFKSENRSDKPKFSAPKRDGKPGFGTDSKRAGGFKSEDKRGSFKSEDKRGGFKSEGKRGSFSGGFKKDDNRKGFKSEDKRGGFKSEDRRGGFNTEDKRGGFKKGVRGQGRSSKRTEVEPVDDGLIRLNRFIANSGICSRRKADELIEAGVVSVNGEVVTTLGFKVDPAKDDVRYNGERLKREKMVYVLLNKPKDYITTTDDPQERKTVMHLVAKASKERIYPVGRLDRNTTGLLLLTNDGNLAEKLAHPRNRINKLYHVELNKNLTQGDFNKITFGVELEDGFIRPDDLSYVQGASKREVGIQIHSGKNRIVRRIFESLGYEVVKLDRVVYANLTKKDLPRGHWRYLTDQEIIQLKHLMK